MDTLNKKTLNQLRSSFLHIKKNRLEEPADGQKTLYDLLSGYEDFLIEATLYVLQGGLEYEEFAKKDEIFAEASSISEDQKMKFETLLIRMEELEVMDGLIKAVIQQNLINVIFNSVSPDTKFTGIYNASGQLEAESLRLFLNSLGFPVRIYQESAGVVYGLTVGPLGLAEIMVPEEDEEQAKEILQAMEEGLFIQEEDEFFQESDDDIEEVD